MTASSRLDPRPTDRSALAGDVAALLASGHRLALVAAHEDDDGFRVVYVLSRAGDPRPVELVLPVPLDDCWVPSLAATSYPAGRFEREVRDLYGIRPEAHPLPYRLVRHGHWPRGWYPMRRGALPPPAFDADVGSFPFLEVQGEGVYEIPVGPVHAGLIEPGHFRFSVVGETILRMKARLWFLHRGVEQLFEGRVPADGIELAERISGDTAVGHSLAYVMAVEDAAGVQVSESDRLLRALLLELERLHNHVADLGALANDVGFGVVNAHALRLREDLLRLNRAVTGHRLLRGALTVGGTRIRELPDPVALNRVDDGIQELVDVTLGHSVVHDRFAGTASLAADQAGAVGALGYVARASGIDADERRDHPFADLGPRFQVVVEAGGDVLGRYVVRAREARVSAAVAVDLAARLGSRLGSGRTLSPSVPGAGFATVEAWRGALAHRVELGEGGRLARVKVVDPSFFNWPGLPMALADTIVPDFPLANKSFNQSYAGNDL